MLQAGLTRCVRQGQTPSPLSAATSSPSHTPSFLGGCSHLPSSLALPSGPSAVQLFLPPPHPAGSPFLSAEHATRSISGNIGGWGDGLGSGPDIAPAQMADAGEMTSEGSAGGGSGLPRSGVLQQPILPGCTFRTSQEASPHRAGGLGTDCFLPSLWTNQQLLSWRHRHTCLSCPVLSRGWQH